MLTQGWALTLAIGLSLGGVALANEEDKEDDPRDQITYPENEVDELEGEGEELMPDLQSGRDSVQLAKLSTEETMELQRKLQEKGHYQGAIDGIVGAQTKAALEAFQKQEGIAVEASGTLDSETASALGLTLSALQPVSGEEVDTDLQFEFEPQAGQTDIPKADIAAAQERLSKLGFFAGEATGTLDVETMNALRKFQRSKGIPETGLLDDQTSIALGIKVTTEVEKQSGIEVETESGDVDETRHYNGMQTRGTGNDVAIDPQVGTDTTTQQFDKDTIKKVERALLVRRIDVKMNGVLDKNEKKAIKRFQKENGLTATGKLDAETLAKLGIKLPQPDVEVDRPIDTTDPMTPPPDTIPPDGTIPPR